MKYIVSDNKQQALKYSNVKDEEKPHEIDHNNLSLFIHQELASTRVCGCPECRYRQTMFNAIQNIIDVYYGLKSN